MSKYEHEVRCPTQLANYPLPCRDVSPKLQLRTIPGYPERLELVLGSDQKDTGSGMRNLIGARYKGKFHQMVVKHIRTQHPKKAYIRKRQNISAMTHNASNWYSRTGYLVHGKSIQDDQTLLRKHHDVQRENAVHGKSEFSLSKITHF